MIKTGLTPTAPNHSLSIWNFKNFEDQYFFYYDELV